jgi:cardiolipin synthase
MRHIPNILTFFRILLVPVFLYFILSDEYKTAAAVFITAGVTDAVDGFIARRFNVRTELGTALDPFADKFLLISAYIALAAKGFIPVWLMVPVLIKDSILLSGVAALKGAGRKVKIVPSVFGKATTVLQIVTVIYAMLVADTGAAFFALAAVTAIVTVYTGIDYVRKEFLIQTGRR